MPTSGLGLPRRDVAAIKRVKAWAEAALALPEGQSVFVTELRCSEEGCPPIETIIAIVGGAGGKRQGKIGCPAGEVNQIHVEMVCAALLGGASAACDHEAAFTD